MSRTGRKHGGTGIYHVMLRGINRQGVFEEPEDYWGLESNLSPRFLGIDYYCPFNLHPDDRSIIVPSNKRDAIIKGHRK